MNTPSDSLAPGLLRTRRSFLHGSILGAATAWTMPGFLAHTVTALEAQATGQATQDDAGADGRILVVLQLAGGNDGLNTVVPFTDDAYRRHRSSLQLPDNALLRLDDHVALAPSLGGLKRIYDEGHLAVVQGVGYPNPNRSHFRSTEIWQCATDADKVSKTGWLGRYFDNACDGAPNPTVGVSLSDQAPQAFSAEKHPGIAMSSPEMYRWVHGRDAALEDAFEELNSPDGTEMMSGGSIVTLAGGKPRPASLSESPLAFLERTALNAQISSDKVAAVTKKAGKAGGSDYPGGNRLAQSLQLVSRMIAGGLPARVYYVSHGGFDTHNNQGGERGTHQNLLRQLDAAVSAFASDLKAHGLFDRVALMTFSEFGRRVRQNGSGGTDHGTAAPLFVLGGGIQGGLHGTAPSLTDLDDGDLKFTTDFRSVYSTLLSGWLAMAPEKVLGRDYPRLGLIG